MLCTYVICSFVYSAVLSFLRSVQSNFSQFSKQLLKSFEMKRSKLYKNSINKNSKKLRIIAKSNLFESLCIHTTWVTRHIWVSAFLVQVTVAVAVAPSSSVTTTASLSATHNFSVFISVNSGFAGRCYVSGS